MTKNNTANVAIESAQPLRADIFETLLEMISKGEIAAGERIVESKIAEILGVSRTPVREALLHLEREGLVRSELSRGYTVTPLSRREIQETYPILWTLDTLAMRLSGEQLKVLVGKLRECNEKFRQNANSPALARESDADFHKTLTSRCGNIRLLSSVARLSRLLGRYEQYYMAHANLVEVSCAQHEDIIAAIEVGDIDLAVLCLEKNWRFGMSVLLEQLKQKLTD